MLYFARHAIVVLYWLYTVVSDAVEHLPWSKVPLELVFDSPRGGCIEQNDSSAEVIVGARLDAITISNETAHETHLGVPIPMGSPKWLRGSGTRSLPY